MTTSRWFFIVCIVTLLIGCRQVVEQEPGTSPTPTPAASPTPTAAPQSDYGDGSDGDLLVASDVVVNTCHVVMGSSSNALALDNVTGFQVGDRVLIIQMQDEFATSGATATVTDALSAGLWEMRRITVVNGTFVDVDTPLGNTYTTTGGKTAQACLVPEYTQVTVSGAGRILPTAWDGSTGGVVAFFASEFLQVDGSIDASNAGFLGGTLPPNQAATVLDIVTEDAAFGDAGGKGQGLDGLSLTLAGRGAMANAGGGGNAHNAGGGGGGNGGVGGVAGMQAAQVGTQHINTPGRGGGAVDLATIEFPLVLGGGGGTGHQNNNEAGVGGAGGGIVWIATPSLTGNGPIRADGQVGEDSANAAAPDGAGGGGAGGTIWIQADGGGYTGALSALGGNGGHNASNGSLHGTGGGGGGGRLIVLGTDSAQINTAGGSSGLNINLANNPHGATAGAAGTIEVAPAPEQIFE